MSDAIKRLKEERAKAWAANQELRARVTAEGFDPMKDSDATDSYNRSNDEVGRLSGLIEDLERGDKLGESMSGATVSPGHGESRTDERDLEDRYKDAVNAEFRRRPGQMLSAEHRAAIDEYRASPNLTNTNGDGSLIPVTTLNKLTEAQKAYGGVLRLAEILDTSTGNAVNWPTADTTAEVGVVIGEGVQVAQDFTSFSQKTLTAYAYNTKVLKLSDELVQDNEFDLVGYVSRKLMERLGRAVSQDFVTGNGTTAPQGLVTGLASAGLTATTGNGFAPTYNNLVDLQHSVDPAYRANGNTVFLMNDQTLAQIRKIVNTVTGTPLWTPSMQDNDPDKILSRPVYVDQGLATPTASAKTIVFGDIKEAYIIRRVAGVRVDVFNELYREFRLTGYMATQRWDAKVQNAGAAKYFVAAAT